MEKKPYPVIVISREYGSGGHEIAEILSKKLSIPFYDNELITMASKDSGYAEEAFVHSEEVATNIVSFSLKMMDKGEYGMPLNNQLFLIQCSMIRSIAEAGPAVIVGRCADYVLDGVCPVVNVFVQSEYEHRLERIQKRHPGITRTEAETMMKKKDKYRSTYYNYYTDRKWGSRLNYDIVINTARMSIEEAADVLEAYIRNCRLDFTAPKNEKKEEDKS